jgi:hypothetical protein
VWQAVDRCAAPGGGDWTGHSSEWAGDGDAPATEEAASIGYFSSWWQAGPGSAAGLTNSLRRRLGTRKQLVAGDTAHWQGQ